jgi:hypothetical protein
MQNKTIEFSRWGAKGIRGPTRLAARHSPFCCGFMGIAAVLEGGCDAWIFFRF